MKMIDCMYFYIAFPFLKPRVHCSMSCTELIVLHFIPDPLKWQHKSYPVALSAVGAGVF